MKKINIFRIVCMILLAVSLLTAVSCEDPTCEEREETAEDRLRRYVDSANERLRVNCCGYYAMGKDTLNESLFNFAFIQETYSGKKLCKIEDTTYNYPKYVYVWENRDHPVTENTRYNIELLPKNDIGLYTGIRIVPYDSETSGKISAMNELLKQYRIFSRYKEDVEKLHEAYKPFQSKYSGKLLYVDEFKGEIYCPNYTWGEEKNLPENSEKGNYVVVFWSTYGYDGKSGFYTGITISNFLQPIQDDYIANSREIVYWKKSMSYKYEEEPRYDPDERHEGQSSLKFPDIYMMPDINVKLK